MNILLVGQVWGFISSGFKSPQKRNKTILIVVIGLVLYGLVKYDAWRTHQIKTALTASEDERISIQKALSNLQTLGSIDDLIAREVSANLQGYHEQTSVLIDEVLSDVRRIQADAPITPSGSVGERVVLERETVREVPVVTRSDRVAERLLIGMWDVYCQDAVGDPRLCAQRATQAAP